MNHKSYLLLLLVFINATAGSAGEANQDAQGETPQVSYAIFENPRVHRSSSSVYALRIDGKRIRPGRELKVEPGVHSLDLVFNGQREVFEGQIEMEFRAGETYLPKYRRVDRKGLEHIVLRVVNAKTKNVVGKTKPYLPRYSRRAVNR